MKILYNYQIFHLKYGGIAKYIFELIKNISSYKNKNIDIKINSPFYKNSYIANEPLDIEFSGVRFPDFRGSGKLCSLLNSLLSPISIYQFNPDIIHETYYNSINKKKKNIKKIITVHDMISELFPEYFYCKGKTSKIKKIAVDEADHIMCISKKTQDDLIRLFNVDIRKTSVAYLSPSTTKNEKIKYFTKEQKPYLLYVGSRFGYKNFKRFIEAYSHPKIKDYFNLIIFGGGKFNKDEISLFEELKIKKNSLKQISGNDILLSSYYKEASLFVYPSLYEGFGIPPLEAMNNCCPVICSNAGSIPEIVGDAAVLFDPYSLDSIRNAIFSVVYNDNLKQSLILKGSEQVKKFSWEKCAKETYKVYEKILS